MLTGGFGRERRILGPYRPRCMGVTSNQPGVSGRLLIWECGWRSYMSAARRRSGGRRAFPGSFRSPSWIGLGAIAPGIAGAAPVASYGRRRGNAEVRVPDFHLRVMRRLARPHGIRNRAAGKGLLAVSAVGEGDPRIDGRAVVFVRARAGRARRVRDARVGGPVIRDTKAGEGGVAQRAGVGKLRVARRERLAHPCSAEKRCGVPGGDVPFQGDEAVSYWAGKVGGVALGLDGPGDDQQARGEGLREILTTRRPSLRGPKSGGGGGGVNI